MSAPELQPALAAGLKAGRFGRPATAGLTLQERRFAFCEVSARRGREDARDAVLQDAFGFAAAGPGKATAAVGVTALRLSPATILILGPASRLATLPGLLSSDIAACIDQSGGLCVLRLVGAPAREALAHGCRFDLHPSVFGPGSVARTLMAQMPVILHQVDDAPSFDLIVPRTLARSFAAFLRDAGEPHGLDILLPDDAA